MYIDIDYLLNFLKYQKKMFPSHLPSSKSHDDLHHLIENMSSPTTEDISDIFSNTSQASLHNIITTQAAQDPIRAFGIVDSSMDTLYPNQNMYMDKPEQNLPLPSIPSPPPAPSSSSNTQAINETHLRECLAENGFTCKSVVGDLKVSLRIEELNTSASVLIEAVKIGRNLQHPYMQSLSADYRDSFTVQEEILQLFNNRGVRQHAKKAIIEGNNIPENIVRALIASIRRR